MSILLTKHHDVSDFASKDASRYIINSVHYNSAKQLVEATDGRVVIRVPVTVSDEFPPVKGQVENPPVDCIIPIAPFKKGLGNAKATKHLPILGYSRIDANGKVTLTTTDLDTEQAVTCKPIEGNYPNIDQVMPAKEPTLTIAIGAAVLSKIADYAAKHSTDGDKTIVFQFSDKLSVFGFSINVEDVNGKAKATGAAMPIRIQ